MHLERTPLFRLLRAGVLILLQIPGTLHATEVAKPPVSPQKKLIPLVTIEAFTTQKDLKTEKNISDLEASIISTAVFIPATEGEPSPVVPQARVRGIIRNRAWGLLPLYQTLKTKQELALKKSQEGLHWEVLVPIEKRLTEFQITAVSPKGELLQIPYQVSVQSWEELEVYSGRVRHKFWGIGASLGLTHESYTQNRVPNIEQIELTWKTSVYFEIPRAHAPPVWQFSIVGFGTVVPIHVAPDSTYGIRFLGLNARAGYLFHLPKGWTIGLSGGYYFTTMFPIGQTFGYRNASGPQLFPSVRKTFGTKHALSTYVKVSPVVASGGILSLDSREIATGLAWTWRWIPSVPMTTSFDLSILDIEVPGFSIQNRALSLSVGFAY